MILQDFFDRCSTVVRDLFDNPATALRQLFDWASGNLRQPFGKMPKHSRAIAELWHCYIRTNSERLTSAPHSTPFRGILGDGFGASSYLGWVSVWTWSYLGLVGGDQAQTKVALSWH